MNENDLQGEMLETPSVSPTEMTTAGEDVSVNPEGAGNLSPEEAHWNSLKGQSQDRFRELSKTNAQLREELEMARRQAQYAPSYAPSYQQPSYVENPGVVEAVNKLEGFGVATKKYVDQKIDDQVNNRLSNLVYQMELERLEGKYSGNDGLPKFDRSEYQEFLQLHPEYRNYTPEDVYQKMYDAEILDWKVQNYSSKAQPKSNSSSLRPTKTQVREEPLTPEMIDQRLREPDGKEWYDRNLSKINKVLSIGSSE